MVCCNGMGMIMSDHVHNVAWVLEWDVDCGFEWAQVKVILKSPQTLPCSARCLALWWYHVYGCGCGGGVGRGSNGNG